MKGRWLKYVGAASFTHGRPGSQGGLPRCRSFTTRPKMIETTSQGARKSTETRTKSVSCVYYIHTGVLSLPYNLTANSSTAAVLSITSVGGVRERERAWCLAYTAVRCTYQTTDTAHGGQVISAKFQIQTKPRFPVSLFIHAFPSHYRPIFLSRRTEAPKPQRPALPFSSVLCSAELSATISLRSVQEILYWPVLRFLGGNNRRSLNTFRAFAFSRSLSAAEKGKEKEARLYTRGRCLLWTSSPRTKQHRGGGRRTA